MHTTCGAKTRSGEPCKTPPVMGGTSCKMHGAGTKQSQAKSAERLLEVRVGQELARQQITPVTDPLQALMDAAGSAVAWMRFCQARLTQLTRLEYEDDKSQLDVVPMIALYERSLDRACGVLAKMVQLGIQDRVAKSAELTAEANLQALRGLIRAARASDASEEELLLGVLGGMMSS